MLNHYGWIMAYGDIDHPDVGKTNGRIYVNRRDIKRKTRLVRGDVVTFYLYADEQGLGAEQCALERRAVSDYPVADGFDRRGTRFFDHKMPGTLCLSSAWNVFATDPGRSAATQFSPEAPEFVPAALTASSNILINPAFLSDDESDGELTHNDADVSSNDGDKESTGDESDACPKVGIESDEAFVGLTNYKDLSQCFCHDDDYESTFVGLTNYRDLSQCFCHDDDYESMFVGLTNYKELAQCFSHDEFGLTNYKELAQCFSHDEYVSDDGLVVVHAPFKAQQPQSDDSTSAGASTDSECEVSDDCMIAPPGLQLPTGFRPPPGLAL